MRRAAILLALLAACAAAAPAQAIPPDAWQRKALTVAGRAWHPACGAMRISWETPPPAFAAYGGWSYAGECLVHIPVATVWMGYPHLCQVVLHEAGHIAGRPHADRGLMASEDAILRNDSLNVSTGRRHVQWSGVDRRCIRPMDVR